MTKKKNENQMCEWQKVCTKRFRVERNEESQKRLITNYKAERQRRKQRCEWQNVKKRGNNGNRERPKTERANDKKGKWQKKSKWQKRAN